jgi:hypothetical protein
MENMTEAGPTMNIARVFVGGILAGVVISAITGAANTFVLQNDFLNWAAGMEGHLHPPKQGVQVSLWTVMALLDGLVSVWIYAGLRTSCGAGAKTALLSGFLVWIVGRFCVALDMIGLGVFPLRLLLGQSMLGLFSLLPGSVIGAWLYKE